MGIPQAVAKPTSATITPVETIAIGVLRLIMELTYLGSKANVRGGFLSQVRLQRKGDTFSAKLPVKSSTGIAPRPCHSFHLNNELVTAKMAKTLLRLLRTFCLCL